MFPELAPPLRRERRLDESVYTILCPLRAPPLCPRDFASSSTILLYELAKAARAFEVWVELCETVTSVDPACRTLTVSPVERLIDLESELITAGRPFTW